MYMVCKSDDGVLCDLFYKVAENATDDLEYWLSVEPSASQPSTLPGDSDTTKQQVGPTDDSTERPTTSVRCESYFT